MTGILDQYMKTADSRPATSLDEVFGIALARALGDDCLVDIYRKVAAEYPHLVLAAAAKRLLRRGAKNGPRFTDFYRELTHRAFTATGSPPEIVALKIERKVIGIAVFLGSRLVHTELRHLRYSNEDAVRSAAGLIRRLSEDHPEASFAFEVRQDKDTRLASIIESALAATREVGVAVWTFSLEAMLEAFSQPSCKTRDEMRAVVAGLFPQRDLCDRTAEVDALALGLLAYCQVLLHAENGREQS